MNKAEKLLVEALRSGEYTQVLGALCSVDGHCCLGVACEVYQKIHKDLKITKRHYGTLTKFDSEMDVLPTKVQKWLNWKTRNGKLSTGNTLINLNDNGTSFEEIADLIEEGKVLHNVN